MERICPFLALGVDHRTVIDGYDPDHFCHARTPPVTLERAKQAEACLVDAHRQCEFYAAFLAEREPSTPAGPLPASDTHLARTRLVLAPESRRLAASESAPFGMSAGRWLVAGGVAAVGVAAAATVAAGGLAPLAGLNPSPTTRASQPVSRSASPSATATQPPTATPELTPASTASGTPEPTATPAATPIPQPPAGQPASPTPQTYVVQEGDTLSIIAGRFGTSVSALQSANGIGDPDEIVPGQVLVIPS